jgi:transcriptional regulator with XRE-family HTH domain
MNTLREARIKRGLTQKQLGEMCGIFQPNIGTWERAKFTANRKTRQRIEAVLGTRIDWIETGKIRLRSGDWITAEKLLARLIGIVVAMPETERKEFTKMILKQFKMR